MVKLIAKARILYKSIQYSPGDELPQDSDMSEAWLAAGSAVIREESTPPKLPKVTPVSAQAGVEGINVLNSETDETITGKVPLTENRKKSSATKRNTKKRVQNE